MDSITQAVLGAAVGEALLGKRIGYKGALVGAIIATIPDLDVLLYLFYSKLDMLSIHRGLSHSILFNILLSFLLAFFLLRFKWTRGMAFSRLLILSSLALLTHVILDSFTAYGTQLFLPFSDVRVGFDSINVVDPMYTIPLMVGLFWTMFNRKEGKLTANGIGIIISSLYLFSTLILKEEMNDLLIKDISEQDIEYVDIMTIPVGIAGVKWYGVVKGENKIYLKKYDRTSSSKGAFQSFPINDELLEEVPDELAEKMRWFAKGFYTVSKVDENNLRVFNLQVDMRGVSESNGEQFPTAGYFLLSRSESGNWIMDSGTVMNE